MLLEGLTPSLNINTCRVNLVMKQLDESDRDILQKALDDRRTWKSADLSRQLASREIEISAHSLQRHRRNECACA